MKSKVGGGRLCPDCETPMQAVPNQSEYISGKTFRIPFTDICLTVYHDNANETWNCYQCSIDRDMDRQREIYDAGWNAGVDKVLYDE